MKIHLEEHELKEIIQDHLISHMPDLNNRTFEIQLIAGRGDNGHRAEIEIVTVHNPPNVTSEAEAEPETVAGEDPAVPFKFGEDESEDS